MTDNVAYHDVFCCFASGGRTLALHVKVCGLSVKDLKYTVWQTLPCIFKNALAVLTTWTGSGKKTSFRDLSLRTILQRACFLGLVHHLGGCPL
ncbi:hypothetical protein UPYG_G00086900 [Umbra pygmaea]|uniref:Uncharacterized protein n=1 Tax=Umbra pygmaea TaxID=75934 RepID=A0ABD0XF05_UMBPY